MKIKQLVVGELDENCYILEKDGKYLVSDPGDEFIKIDNEIHGELEEILVTHNHFDCWRNWYYHIYCLLQCSSRL